MIAGNPSLIRDTLLFAMATKAKSPAVAPTPAHLRPEGLAFLRNLARNNDREWFTPRKAVYEAELKEPMLAIIRKVTDAMTDFAPHHVRPAEKSLFRIYRDTRFSADKKPYKTHVAAWWSFQGLEKTSGAGYYFHISAKETRDECGDHAGDDDRGSDPGVVAAVRANRASAQTAVPTMAVGSAQPSGATAPEAPRATAPTPARAATAGAITTV